MLLQLLLLFTHVCQVTGACQCFAFQIGMIRQIFLFGRHSVPCYNLSYKLGFGGNAYGT